MSIKEQIHDLSDEMITNIGRLVAIDSQLGMPGEGKPFGEGPAEALKEGLKIAEELGFIPVNPAKENLEGVVKDATNGEGCDVFFECSGAAVPAMQMTDITRVRGKICIVSVHKKPHEVNLRDVNFKEQTVVGTRVYTKEEFGRAAELTKELEAELEKIVTHVVPLKESDKVFDMIADPECGTIKIVVDCENV